MDEKKKFLFDLNYFDDDNVMHVAEDPNAPPPAPTFSEEELQAAKDEAQKSGYEDGQKAALESIEQQKLQTLQSIQQSLSALFDCEEDRNQKLETHVIALTYKALTKLYPIFMESAGTQEVRALLSHQLQELRKSPAIDITLPPQLAAKVEDDINALKERLAAQGSWTIMEDDSLSAGACQITWEHGGLEWQPDMIYNAIQAVFQPHLDKLTVSDEAELDDMDQNLHNEETKKIKSVGDQADTPETDVAEQPISDEEPQDG